MTLAEIAARLRLVNPVMRREMVQRMRMPWTSWLLFLYVALLGGAALLYLYLSGRTSIGTSFHPRMGLMVFGFLTTLQVYLLALLTPAATAGAVTEERTRGTFDLLLVSEMGPASILLGKLGASVCWQLMLIAASAPLYMAMLLFGGIGWKDLLMNLGILVSAAALISAVCIMASSLFRRESPAVVTAYMLCLLLFGAPLVYNLVPEAPAYTRAGRIQRRAAPWVQALSPGRVMSAALGLDGGGLSALGLLARASGAATISTVQGGWRGTPLQITLSDGSTVLLTQNTAGVLPPNPQLAGRPLWLVHIGLMQAGTILFMAAALSAVTQPALRLTHLTRKGDGRGVA